MAVLGLCPIQSHRHADDIDSLNLMKTARDQAETASRMTGGRQDRALDAW